MKDILLGLIICFFLGCNSSNSTLSNMYPRIVSGQDINGESKSCVERINITCDNLSAQLEQFTDECLESGNRAVACDCDNYICVDPKLRKGFDMDGKERSCLPAPDDLICTTVFTDGDAFADACKNSGSQAIQCGCHDFICLKKIDFRI